MAYPWEFFEELGEMVYVSDMETNELVYMNAHLRSVLGYQCHEEYVGKKCYEVLLAKDSPCSFCNNCHLEEGKFISLIHKNPVLNRRFLLRDSLIRHQDKRYRIEIAIDIDSQSLGQVAFLPTRGSEILNGCLQRVCSTTDPEEALTSILSYMGKNLLCDRIHIFEWNHSNRMTNTYEWCDEGVEPHRQIQQDEPRESVQAFLRLLDENHVVIVQDIEEIRKNAPAAYAYCKYLNIASFVLGALKSEGKTIGFISVDQPDVRMLPLIKTLLEVLGHFVVSLLKGRELVNHLREMGMHDQLTGAFNRNALVEFCENTSLTSIGVIFCDITGLKQMNDMLGHRKGDQVILRCYELLHESLKTDLIYRTGGDEFVILFPYCGQNEFDEKVRHLHGSIRQCEYHIAVGHTWSDQQPLCLDSLIETADSMMYEDKRSYYALREMTIDDKNGNRGQRDAGKIGEDKSQFCRFIENTYCDMEVAFQSFARENSSSYFYFGDMQKDLFYISDNLKEDFGFENNVVSGWLRLWSQRISTPEFQDLFWQDISALLREKRELHNLRYQVRDIHGNIKWMHCYALMKWSEDKGTPLFFSGRISHQDNRFAVDPITNFPREYVAFEQLYEMQKCGQKTQIIGFSLNNITELNSTRGRTFVDRLLQHIANKLTEVLSWKITFHRLEGMRFMAVANPICVDAWPDTMQQIRDIIEECYHVMGIAVHHTCSFGVLEYPCENLMPEDMVENLVALIRLAKQESDRPYVSYSAESITRIQQLSNMALALEQDVLQDMRNFRVVVQPVVSAKDGRVIGGETLLRWNFAGKDVSPAVFIPILERDSMIYIAGRWVFEQAVRNCVQMINYDPDFYLTFNVSLHQLSDPELLQFMKQTLEKYHLDGSHLVAELTESCLDEQPQMLERFVGICNKLRIRIALDDFGSGYSSLRMLLQYPSSIIKLDRSLLHEITDSDQKMHFIRSIVYACHQFGKQVCMEGVERTEQNKIIRNTGCDMIQGYYYYRPMELSAIYCLLDQA